MFIEPMLLQQKEQPYYDTNVIWEPKADGHRLIYSRINGELKYYTRHHNEITGRYPEIHDLPVDGDVILDGEIVCINPETGAIDFELISSRFQTKTPKKIVAAMQRLPVFFVVFDILYYKGQDLRNLPLMARKEILLSVIPDTMHITKTPFVEADGITLFDSIKNRNGEGCVSKKKDSIYVGKRSADWVKVINYQYAKVFLSGYKKEGFGWLASIEEKGKMRSVGTIELGVPPKCKKAFYSVSKTIITGEDRNFVFLQPAIKATVKFRNWTKSGMLRSPVFVDFDLSA
ncbi:ATP-dependent DNA ligase [Brevibacillus sp. IT-7CA2]|uniref:ATP-dependent DNA ligase n=1 Tax=Brevibacillus sp. IT-7CA2 TaxID=3026436 RepID=UPI0039E17E00